MEIGEGGSSLALDTPEGGIIPPMAPSQFDTPRKIVPESPSALCCSRPVVHGTWAA